MYIKTLLTFVVMLLLYISLQLNQHNDDVSKTIDTFTQIEKLKEDSFENNRSGVVPHIRRGKGDQYNNKEKTLEKVVKEALSQPYEKEESIEDNVYDEEISINDSVEDENTLSSHDIPKMQEDILYKESQHKQKYFEANMKIKGKVKNGVLEAKVQLKHEMMTYKAAKKAGKEANFITHIVAKVNNRVVFEASTSQFLSKDPIIKFSAKGDGIKNRDILEITYIDLQGNIGVGEGKIKVR